MSKVSTVFRVKDALTRKNEEIEVTGSGDPAVNFVRSQYSELSRIVLVGFRIDGKFFKLKKRRWVP